MQDGDLAAVLSRDRACGEPTATLFNIFHLVIHIKSHKPHRTSQTQTLLSSVVGASIECEQPNSAIYRFDGALTLPSSWSAGAGAGGAGAGVDNPGTHPPLPAIPLPLFPNQLLLRGCVLRNTAWVVATVVFNGRQAKVAMNATAVPSKRSAVERRLDGLVVLVFLALGAMATLDAVLGAAWLDKRAWYLALGDPSEPAGTRRLFDPAGRAVAGALGFLTALALYSSLIPISLYVSIEVIKYLQVGCGKARGGGGGLCVLVCGCVGVGVMARRQCRGDAGSRGRVVAASMLLGLHACLAADLC